MRYIDADKLYPDCMTKNGTLAISQSQIANAPTVVKNEITLNLTPEERQQWLEKWSSALNEQGNITMNDTTTEISTKDKQKANGLLNAYADGYVVGFEAGQKERQQGEWISPTKNTDFSNRDLFSDCSICGHTQMDETNFCPNCGADMRGERNGRN